MESMDEEELGALRRRAYGPNADIHLDARALERLQELEVARRRRGALEAEIPSRGAKATDRHELVVLPSEVEQPDLVEDEHDPPAYVMAKRLLGLARTLVKRLLRVRRSTVLILIGLAVVATIAIVTLVVVQRVQTDPLQAGASQVARLPLDPTFTVPKFFGGVGADEIQGFQEFHGLRVVLGTSGTFAGDSRDDCLLVYSIADFADSATDSSSGILMAGCAAGAFPAMTQFRADSEGLPEEILATFPGSTALQFVYDSAHHEVVVFANE